MNQAGPEQLCEAIATLRSGGLVAFPTETVYALGADALNEDAVRRVFRLKARPANNPLIVHVSGIEMAREAGADWPPPAEALAEAFWPGPLTLVLPRRRHVPDIVTAGGPTVALRAPDHHLALALIDAYAGPLVGPSANSSGGLSPTHPAHVRREFPGEHIPVLDGGPCRVGIESTVVRFGQDHVEILRAGVLGEEELSRAAGIPVRPSGRVRGGGNLESPGLAGPHYRPRTPAVLVREEDLDRLLRRSERVCLVAIAGSGRAHAHVRLPPDAAGYARRLYAALREADESGADLIAIVRPPLSSERPGESSIWRAVMERLTRAAEPWGEDTRGTHAAEGTR